MVKTVGFRELHWHQAPAGASLREAVRVRTHPNAGRVVAYLHGGTLLAARPMVVGDFLRPERELVSTSHWYTDGVWVWPTDLVYYVEKYHAELPAEFVSHMESAGWVCPQLSREHVTRVFEWWALSWPLAESHAATDPVA